MAASTDKVLPIMLPKTDLVVLGRFATILDVLALVVTPKALWWPKFSTGFNQAILLLGYGGTN